MFMQFKPLEGPSYWAFKDPDSGYEYKANSKKELVKLIVSYRAQNELDEIQFLDLVIDNYLCSLPANVGRCRPIPSFKRGLMQTIRGGIGLLENWLYDKTVDQETADSRAEVCLKCPNNIFPKMGGFDRWATEVAIAALGDDRKSFHNDQLGVCEICSCPLRSKIYIAPELVELTKAELAQMPDFCWQKKEVQRPTTQEGKTSGK